MGEHIDTKASVDRKITGSSGYFHSPGKVLSPPKKSSCIFVGGLPSDCGEEKLKEYFGQFGKISHVVVRANRGFGFVTFEDPEIMQIVMAKRNLHLIDGRDVV